MATRNLSPFEYQVSNYGMILAIEITHCIMPPTWDDVNVGVSVRNQDGSQVFGTAEGFGIYQGKGARKIIVRRTKGRFDERPTINIGLGWQSGVHPPPKVPDQFSPKAWETEFRRYQEALKKHIAALNREKAELQKSWSWTLGVGEASDRIYEIQAKVIKLEGRLGEVMKILGKLNSSWQGTSAYFISEASPVGAYYRIFEGRSITSGETVSGAERALEGLLLGAFSFALLRRARAFKPRRPGLTKVKNDVPEMLKDLAPLFKRKKQTMNKVTKVYSKHKTTSKKPLKAAGKKLDKYREAGAKQPPWQSLVMIERKGDRITIYRTTSLGPFDARDIKLTPFKQELPFSSYQKFIDQHMFPVRGKEGWFFNNVNHPYPWP